ncbi:MAG: hypothetical protein ACHP85_23175 [Burkholderiales bacterium]|jgi:hypothetical protein
MGRWLTTLLVVGAATSALGQDGTARFAATLPAAVGDVSRWQLETGSFETQNERGSYMLYVNPARSALYQLMRYRVELLGSRSPQEQQRAVGERLAFIARPGVQEPMLCWERLGGAAPAWREIAAGTGEYVLEMNVLMRVLVAQRAARTAAP